MRRLRNNAQPSLWSEGRALLIIAPVFSLMFLYQNCAPAPLQSREFSSGDSNVEMSTVEVHLTHDPGLILSDVELVADDVMTTIDRVPSSASIVPEIETQSTSVVLDAPKTTIGSSFMVELPRGAQKIIVARAKTRDPVSNAVSSYYGNAILTPHEASSEVTIQLVAQP